MTHHRKKGSCCDNPDVIYDNKAEICQNCGLVKRYFPDDCYIDFYDQMYRFKRKFIYDRKYHIYNKIDLLIEKHGLKITFSDRRKIIEIFKQINKILPQTNAGRKRIINVNYILRNISMLTGLSCNIPITKLKKTLSKNDDCWIQILLLIMDKKMKMINQ